MSSDKVVVSPESFGFRGKDGDPVAISLNVQRTFGPDGNSVNFVSAFPQTATRQEMNVVIDKIAHAAERMEMLSRISGMNTEIAHQRKLLLQQEFNVANMKRIHGDFGKANKQVKDQFDASASGITGTKAFITSLEGEQARLRTFLEG